MERNRRAKADSNCRQKVKKLGWELIACCVLVLLCAAISIRNIPNEGELGRGEHAMIPLFLCVMVWGLSTGIGLLRARRWARISMLVFCNLPIVFGVLPTVALVSLPKEDMSGRSKAVVVSVALIPVVIGVRWFNYFRRDDVKSYFQTSPKIPTVFERTSTTTPRQ